LLKISQQIIIPLNEIDISAVRSTGASSLPDFYKENLLNLSDSRISTDGVIVIKAQQFRTQQQNKEDALIRLKDLIKSVSIPQKKRFITKPTKGAERKRLDSKVKRSQLKASRKKIDYD
jgi:ribosome-associated protein